MKKANQACFPLYQARKGTYRTDMYPYHAGNGPYQADIPISKPDIYAYQADKAICE